MPFGDWLDHALVLFYVYSQTECRQFEWLLRDLDTATWSSPPASTTLAKYSSERLCKALRYDVTSRHHRASRTQMDWKSSVYTKPQLSHFAIVLQSWKVEVNCSLSPCILKAFEEKTSTLYTKSHLGEALSFLLLFKTSHLPPLMPVSKSPASWDGSLGTYCMLAISVVMCLLLL